MYINNNNNQYKAALGNAVEIKINKNLAHIAVGLAVAYNIPQTRPYIKPLVDFSITTVSLVSSYWKPLLALAVVYMVMEQTGLLKSCKKACGIY